jgi:hypothetical protein
MVVEVYKEDLQVLVVDFCEWAHKASNIPFFFVFNHVRHNINDNRRSIYVYKRHREELCGRSDARLRRT